jgi:branched-subunit amino acid ABC-type transport system permease component
MKYVRIALGVLLGLYALMGLFNFGTGAAVKSGAMALPASMAKYGPLIEALAWWQVIALIVTMLIYLVAAWRLIRGGKALILYLVAVVIDTALWLYAKTMPVYGEVFTPAELQMEYAFMGAVVVGFLIVWWTERSSAPTATPA